MNIAFLCNYVAGGWKPTDNRLGGTEESIVQWTERLRKRGHTVTIYDNDTRLDYDGGHDVCINVKSSEIWPKEPTLYLTNETNASDLDLSMYDGVIWPSQWCVDNIPVNNENTFILPHGYDPKVIYPTDKIYKQCLYASSPDRGLETLLRAWPRVLRNHPDATLKVTYGAPAIDFPNIEFLGEVDEDMMNQLYRESDVWCHPANGGELFCITGIKAQAAACVPVIIPTMALAETVRHGYFANDAAEYANMLIDALYDDEGRDSLRSTLRAEQYDTWEDSTDKLLQIINKVLP